MEPIEIGGLIVLLSVFLFIPRITAFMKHSLDTLPMRLAGILLMLGALTYNKLLALGVFLVITAIYIQHHHEDVLEIIGTKNNLSAYSSANVNAKFSNAMDKLDQGGSADEEYDSSDFTSKAEDQDNEFKAPDSSIDEKHALNTEPLGSRSESLFPDDSKHVSAMEQGNKNGYFD